MSYRPNTSSLKDLDHQVGINDLCPACENVCLSLGKYRSQLGRWQLEQTAKLMIQVMQLNAKLVKGLKECRARGGPPRIRRCVFFVLKSPKIPPYAKLKQICSEKGFPVVEALTLCSWGRLALYLVHPCVGVRVNWPCFGRGWLA